MKKTLKKVTVVLCLGVITSVMVACGGKTEGTTAAPGGESATTAAPSTEAAPATEAAAVNLASTETWGDYTVGVPEGWKFRKGDVFDEADTRYCSVKKSDFSFFDFKMEKEDTAKQQYEYNKKTYTQEQKDVSGKYGEIDWTGFQYSDGAGGYGFELMATVNGKPVRVSCSGFAFDSAEAKAVLGSLVIK